MSTWAVTSYFNRCRYAQRKRNYDQFRASLRLPLLAVELSFGGPFELGKGDADILVQLDGGDPMWQKERLLNVAVASLPPECDAVVLVDADVVFEEPGWVPMLEEALGRYALVQPFALAHRLERGADPASPSSWYGGVRREGIAQRLGRGGDFRGFIGGVWAARRDLLEEHGLYDACIVGGGDQALVCGAWGDIDRVVGPMRMNEHQEHDYRRWAEPFSRAVGGRVGFVPGRVGLLWHGELANRRFIERHKNLAPYAFDPPRDISTGPQGALVWSSPKPEMHRYVREYFASRQEDG